MIYDCFSFFNELDLLEIRLNILDPVVDKFVLVEATRTHAGKDKPLYYQLNAERFSAFKKKMIHVVVDQFPAYETSWTFENYQRNCISQGLTDAKADDTIIISDIDEIPDPKCVVENAGKPGLQIFEQRCYCYFLNCRRVNLKHWHYRRLVNWEGSCMLSFSEYQHSYDSIPTPKNCLILPESVNNGTTASRIRFEHNIPCTILKNGGWHFTSLGGAEAFRRKIMAFSHQERNTAENRDIANIDERLRHRIDPASGRRLFAMPIDESFPSYIRDHLHKYPHLLYKAAASDIVHDRLCFLPMLFWTLISVTIIKLSQQSMSRLARVYHAVCSRPHSR